MKTLVAAFITTLLVFALSTVWSEAVQPGLDALVAVSSKRVVKERSNPRTACTSNETTTEDSDDDQRQSVSDSSSNKSSKRKVVQQEVKNPPPSQLEQVKFEEAKLVEHQNTIEMIYRDIFREVETLKEIRRRSAVELAAAERRTAEIAAQQVRATTAAIEVPVRPVRNPDAKGGVERRMAVLVQGMVDRGNTKAAAALLAGLKERESSKVLSLLRDPQTATLLADQIRTVASNPSGQY